MNTPAKKSRSNIILWSIVGVVVIFAFANIFKTATAKPPAPAPTATSAPTQTPAPTAIPADTATSAPLPTFVPATVAPFIPAIYQADVTINLEKRFGMECSETIEGDGYYSHSCRKGSDAAEIFVTVYGRGIVSVDFITASVSQFNAPDPLLSADILKFVATIPFVEDDALQKESAVWVEAGTPTFSADYQEIETDINNIHFKLRGTSANVTLEIGELK